MKMAELATVKVRLGLVASDVQYDELLGWMITAVSERFDVECSRCFERKADDVQEFDAQALEVPLKRYPVESVKSWELRRTVGEGWVEQAGVEYLMRGSSVVSLLVPMGSGLERARVTYTGGYVMPGGAVGPGQTALPKVLEAACVEQVAFWFQQRSATGQVTKSAADASVTRVADVDLHPGVRAVLGRFRRVVV